MIKNFSHRMMRLESTLLITELPMQARRGVGGGGVSRGSNKPKPLCRSMMED